MSIPKAQEGLRASGRRLKGGSETSGLTYLPRSRPQTVAPMDSGMIEVAGVEEELE